MEWNGIEWNGMEWNGIEWNGMEWNRIFRNKCVSTGRLFIEKNLKIFSFYSMRRCVLPLSHFPKNIYFLPV
jgi:hypothetical protein